jgi:hypothetical protein
MYQVLIQLPQTVGGLVPFFFFFNVFISFCILLVYFYNTHQVIIGLSQGVGGLAIIIV